MDLGGALIPAGYLKVIEEEIRPLLQLGRPVLGTQHILEHANGRFGQLLFPSCFVPTAPKEAPVFLDYIGTVVLFGFT